MKPVNGKLPNDLEKKIKQYFDEVQKQPVDIDQVDFDQSKVHQKIHASIHTRERFKNLRQIFKYAASIAIFVSLTAVAFHFYSKPSGILQQSAMLEKKASDGNIIKMQLPDGTQVWLNAGSRLLFPAQFDADKREVTLEGEAYFDVRHDAKKPFLIHTQNMVTQVLGTSFNVSSYRQNNSIKVTVLSGKVAVYENSETGKPKPNGVLFVTANQEIVYSKSKKQFYPHKDAVKPADAAAWKEGNLIFKDTEIDEVVQRLERHYAIQIQMDPALDCPVTVNFDHEPLSRVLRVLAQLVNGRILYKDGRYHLTDVICQ
ncbi:FecR family protein [Pedobacter metabolipauper]|uniref:FecR family protein n=1 Tax=Pedobacter metabolipauper TaxID=425513 RepID=A0A4R6T1Y2_9SPHI|nr:FecR domain-containing protein [Pedobacter metabolipauper]TDQ11520.1 FecR family protein [Pedobacter metabolipauper]